MDLGREASTVALVPLKGDQKTRSATDKGVLLLSKPACLRAAKTGRRLECTMQREEILLFSCEYSNI